MLSAWATMTPMRGITSFFERHFTGAALHERSENDA